jgi:hypothetical protein
MVSSVGELASAIIPILGKLRKYKETTEDKERKVSKRARMLRETTGYDTMHWTKM